MMCYKMQGNNDDFNELPSGTVGWAVSCRGKVGFREYCSLNPKGSPFFPEFLSFFIFRVWVRVRVRIVVRVRF